MKIKSLLLGSAAALVAAPAAYAADVIVPEPEMVEYVRVCDMYGTGYFYIPGTETCLKVGGYARYQIGGTHVSFDQLFDDNYGQIGSLARGYLSIDAKSETEYGTLTGSFAFYATRSSDFPTSAYDLWDQAWVADGDGSQGTSFTLDYAYIELAGLRAGYFAHWLDDGIAGETDSVPGLSSKFTSVRYTADMGNFMAGVSIDEIDGDGLWISKSHGWGPGGDSAGIEAGISGMVSADIGAASIRLVGFYDIDAEAGGIEVNGSADVGPGSLAAYYLWNSDWNEYVGTWFTPGDAQVVGWAAGVSYAFDVNDKLTVTPGFNYADAKYDGDSMWRAGVTVDYEIVSGLDAKLSVQYEDYNDDWSGPGDDSYQAWEWFARFTRSF